MNTLPKWFKKEIPLSEKYFFIRDLLKDLKVFTVCKEAKCPNVGECYSKGRATFMILGDTCTRTCGFCAIAKGKPPKKVDLQEPYKIAQAVGKLKLNHVVITSVTRDDLKDGGASQFVAVIKEIKSLDQAVIIEVLVPDFKGNEESISEVVLADPDIFNHNLETIERLYKQIRPEADYERSLNVLKKAKNDNSQIMTKSGIMVGLGETKDEILKVFSDLREVNCDIVTLGQYLNPGKGIKVQEFLNKEQFEEYQKIGTDMGFKYVFAGPLVRSSYHAAEVFEKCYAK